MRKRPRFAAARSARSRAAWPAAASHSSSCCPAASCRHAGSTRPIPTNRRCRRSWAKSTSSAAITTKAHAMHPAIADRFLSAGAEAAAELALAAESEDLEAELRRRRHGLALAVALGDLAGELSLEVVTRLLSDFADSAIDRAVAAAIRERVPDAEPQGFAVIAMGKLGSRELNYSSDVDLLLLFDPER